MLSTVIPGVKETRGHLPYGVFRTKRIDVHFRDRGRSNRAGQRHCVRAQRCGPVVFTEKLQTGLRMSRQIESGAVHINSMTVHGEYTLPHGGVKFSGFGRFNGYQGLDEFLYSKTVTWMD
jgi:hypothetical protein